MALQQDTIQNTVQNVIQDTIVAIATANSLAGVGIVRLSGPQALSIGCALTTKTLVPRHAAYVQFLDAAGESIDDGIAVYFAAPHSYTGEDVVELQAHGNPIVLACLLRRCLALGARLARPGEFTERAFLNEKLDLAQAEAVADLISAGSEAAVRAARRSLDGVFSRRIDAIAEQLTDLRVYVEAALDFPDEEIDFLAAPELRERLKAVTDALAVLRKDAEHGKRLMDGVHAVIVGVPNVGKSSLLNALAGEDRAIVTDIAGTTRDILRETLTLDGVTLTLVDTAGLRDAVDSVEAEGIRRARAEVSRADLVLAVVDDDEPDSCLALADELQSAPKILWLHNKCDLQGGAARVEIQSGSYHFWLSAKTGVGLDILRAHLATGMGGVEGSEGGFSARARHLEALASTQVHLDRAASHLQDAQGELAAEDLRQSQEALGEITGRMDADALLGRIFSSFCIGK